MRPGRLFGWLVSYENPDGRAIELREGKFFVTSSSIKGSDLILEDPSISTPHALMSISDAGLLVQDLMSDHGVFVRAGDDGSYRREDGVIRVSHGDWLKFGDVEFLVIIVPSSSRQG
jgi:pSer/pThr/pTyr-binding forkhead associated (FHA) protein